MEEVKKKLKEYEFVTWEFWPTWIRLRRNPVRLVPKNLWMQIIEKVKEVYPNLRYLGTKIEFTADYADPDFMNSLIKWINDLVTEKLSIPVEDPSVSGDFYIRHVENAWLVLPPVKGYEVIQCGSTSGRGHRVDLLARIGITPQQLIDYINSKPQWRWFCLKNIFPSYRSIEYTGGAIVITTSVPWAWIGREGRWVKGMRKVTGTSVKIVAIE